MLTYRSDLALSPLRPNAIGRDTRHHGRSVRWVTPLRASPRLPAREDRSARSPNRDDAGPPALLRPRVDGEPARYVIGVSNSMTLSFGVLVSLVFAQRRLKRVLARLCGIGLESGGRPSDGPQWR